MSQLKWAITAYSRPQRQKSHPKKTPAKLFRKTVRNTTRVVNGHKCLAAGRCPMPNRREAARIAAQKTQAGGKWARPRYKIFASNQAIRLTRKRRHRHSST